MSIAELRKYGARKPRTAREWLDEMSEEEREVVEMVIVNQPAPRAMRALREHAAYPFGLTALKMLRTELKENA